MAITVGHVYNVQPMAPDPERTTMVDAGAIRIGVEYRDLDPDALFAYYETDEAGLAEIKESAPFGIEDKGVSVHVFGAADGHEYLRFDLFDDGPHYHYVHRSGDRNNIVAFDEVAHGPILQWAMHQLRTRLAEMLSHAGGADLAAALDESEVAAAVDRVEALAVETQARVRASDR